MIVVNGRAVRVEPTGSAQSGQAQNDYLAFSASYVGFSSSMSSVSASYSSFSASYAGFSGSISSVSASYASLSSSYSGLSASYTQVSAAFNRLSSSYNAFSASTGGSLIYLTSDGTNLTSSAAVNVFTGIVSGNLSFSSNVRQQVFNGYISASTGTTTTSLNSTGTGKQVYTQAFGPGGTLLVWTAPTNGSLSHLSARVYGQNATAGALTCSIQKNGTVITNNNLTYQAVTNGVTVPFAPNSLPFVINDYYFITVSAAGWSQAAGQPLYGVNFVLYAYC